MSLYEIKMHLELETIGPILCTSTSRLAWGIDAEFITNHDGKFYIPRSQIKGKLRYGWETISSVIKDYFEDMGEWLGTDDEKNNGNSENYHFKPKRGRLVFSDFFLKTERNQEVLLNRIAIEKNSGTANEGALFFVKTPFKNGESITWYGDIEFIVEKSNREKIKNFILQGLRWTDALGAQKGIGFGRLKSVKLIEEKSYEKEIDLNYKPVNNSTRSMGLKIQLVDPILIGGAKKSSFYIESEKVMPGALLKGSLATCINLILGNNPNGPVNEDKRLPVLTKNFADLRITHAFSGNAKIHKRPLTLPITVFQTGGKYYDAALYKWSDEKVLINNNEPIFQVDWKEDRISENQFGLLNPKTIAVTRTEIDDYSQRSKEKNLYTFEYICPTSDRNIPIAWYANIFFPDYLNEKDCISLYNELNMVTSRYWNYVGKRNSKAVIQTLPYCLPGFVGENNNDGEIIIMLQTDTVMIQPGEKDVNISAHFLEEKYQTYWQEISDHNLEMVPGGFWARQKLTGGYLSRRFKDVNGPYKSYYLTSAGSVFRLSANEEGRNLIKIWKQTGLPVPDWVKNFYCGGTKPSWENFPYIPQNGYGEICVSLDVHTNLCPQ